MGNRKSSVKALLLLLLGSATRAFLQRPSWVSTPHFQTKPGKNSGHMGILPSHGKALSNLALKSNEDDTEGNLSLWDRIKVLSLPIVWVSLYFVKTTGAGLPAGPFGILGALEGLSYVVLLASLPKSSLSRVTVVVALAVLLSLVLDQGCVPNAKPLLDYSNFVPVCEAQPGLFGA